MGSPIIDKQQTELALMAGKQCVPLILNMANTTERLYSILSTWQEILDTVFRLRLEGLEKLVLTECFQVIDRVEKCRTSVKQMEGSLQSTGVIGV